MEELNSQFSVDTESAVAVADPAPDESTDRVADNDATNAEAGPGIADSVDSEATEPPDLLGELARAMHHAAETQFARITAELERQRLRRVEAIAGRASADTEDLSAELDADIRAIDAWAKAETEKIELERMRRVDARHVEHADMVQREATTKEREILAIEVAIDAHRAELATFFTDLGRATDPEQIARVAATMPALPALDVISGHVRAEATSEFALRDDVAETAAGRMSDDNAAVSESRLMAVMDPTEKAAAAADPGATWGSVETRPWDPVPLAEVAPSEPSPSIESSVVTEAGQPDESSQSPEAGLASVADEPVPVSGGSTLLRAIAAFRPMASNSGHSSEPPDRER